MTDSTLHVSGKWREEERPTFCGRREKKNLAGERKEGELQVSTKYIIY